MEEGSVIIKDNASYHSVTANKVPNNSSGCNKRNSLPSYPPQKMEL
jgi:hypothetical protein